MDLEDDPFQSTIPIFACRLGNKQKKFWEGLIDYLALIRHEQIENDESKESFIVVRTFLASVHFY
jgi:hypothetical protein